MINVFLGLALLPFAAPQEAAPAPWKTEAKAAREAAVQGGRPCVLILFADSL